VPPKKKKKKTAYTHLQPHPPYTCKKKKKENPKQQQNINYETRLSLVPFLLVVQFYLLGRQRGREEGSRGLSQKQNTYLKNKIQTKGLEAWLKWQNS
jgi:hypothetical protein